MTEAAQFKDPDIDIIVPEGVVNKRIEEMAGRLVERYSDSEIPPLFVCLMDGGQPFNNDLLSAANRINPAFHPESTSMIVSRYGSSQTASETKLIAPIPEAKLATLPGRRVIFIDDLIDHGGTMQFAINYALHNGAASSSAEVLVRKNQHPQVDVEIEDIGFDGLPSEWLVGKGMDDKGRYRWSGFIAILRPKLKVEQLESVTDLPADFDAQLDQVAV